MTQSEELFATVAAVCFLLAAGDYLVQVVSKLFRPRVRLYKSMAQYRRSGYKL